MIADFNEGCDFVPGKFQIITEDHYIEKMQNEVHPYLDKFKKSGYFKSNEADIYYEMYINPNEKASIVISHGFCEFCNKLEEVIYYFYREGYSVFMPEHRSHGRSHRMVEDPSKVYIETYRDFVDDMHTFITEIVQPNSITKKLVLYGHSMGGAISALMLEHYPNLFLCAVLSSPMLEINMGSVSNRLAWLMISMISMGNKMQNYAPGAHAFDGIPNPGESGATCEARYMRAFQERVNNEKFQTSGATYGWVAASLKALKILHKNTFRIKTPILLFQAENDTMVRPEAQEKFANNTEDTQLVKVANSGHEIYNATDDVIVGYYEKIFDYISKYI